MRKGQPAPYHGVLVPPDAYRYYQADGVLFASCSERLKASVGYCAEPDPWFSPRQFSFMLAGFLLGVIALSRAAP